MKRFFIFLLIIVAVASMEMCATRNAWAAGVAGLNYQNYLAGGAQPGYTQDANGNITNRTLLSTGTVNTVGLTTSSGAGLPTRSDGFIVRFYGYINIPTAGTYYFGGQADDGIRIKVDNVSVVNSWIESGGDFRSGSINLPAGPVPIEIMYYENGGGQMVNFQWFINGSWQIVPSTVLATDRTFFAPPAPVLCCGGSSAAFTNTPANTAKVIAYTNRTIKDSQVYIEQIGNDNTITVIQTGSKNNHVDYTSVGSKNTVNISQSSSSPVAVNYTELKITGNSNTASIVQQSTGGEKSAFVNIANNNNSVLLTQKDSGSHYAEINLSGGNKNVDVLQQGSGNHQTKVGLTGLPVDLSLTQSGSTQQSYSINFNCATTGGCPKIIVTQGQ
jgi:hypothetical protein